MYDFDPNVPATGHNPSKDYSIMKNNNVSSAGIIAVDHLGYGTTAAGTHVKTTFNDLTVPPAPSGTGSVAYPSLGIALPSIPEYYFQNSQATFLLSAIKSFGVISVATGNSGSYPINIPLNLTNQFNVNLATSTQSSTFGSSNVTDVFTINLKNNVTFGNNVVVFIYSPSLSPFTTFTNYSFASNQLIITISHPLAPTYLINFAILQA